MKREVIIEICCALLILLFGYTAASKFLEHEKFLFQIHLSPLPIMKTSAPIISYVIPLAEFMIVLGLLIDQFRIKALWASFYLLIVFELYIAGMLLSNQHLPCTCGGIIAKMSWKQHLLFNAVFIFISIWPIIKNRQTKSLELAQDANSIKNLSRA